MRQSRRALLASAATGTAALAGCVTEYLGGSSEDAVSLVLNWTPNGLHTPYFVADARDYYAEEGLDVEISNGQGADFAAQQAGLGNEEFVITSSEQLLNVNAGDLSPTCVGVSMQTGQVVVLTAREHFGEELTDPAQLEGLTIGSPPGSVRLMTEAYFEQAGILDTLEYRDTGWDTIQQLLSGEIDVAGGVFSEIVDASGQGYEIDAIDVADTIDSYGHVIATEDAYAAENEEIVEGFLRATARGFVWASHNPEEAIDHVIDAKPELEEVRENELQKWKLMAESYVLSPAVEEHGWGWSEPGPWQETHDVLESGGFLDSAIDAEGVWTNDYLDTDDDYLGGFSEEFR